MIIIFCSDFHPKRQLLPPPCDTLSFSSCAHTHTSNVKLAGDPRRPIAVDRVDIKRGYCFVFLKDVTSQAEKERIENYVADIGGM